MNRPIDVGPGFGVAVGLGDAAPRLCPLCCGRQREKDPAWALRAEGELSSPVGRGSVGFVWGPHPGEGRPGPTPCALWGHPWGWSCVLSSTSRVMR